MMEQPTKQKRSIKGQYTKLLLAIALAFTNLTPLIANANAIPPKPGQPGIVKPPPEPPAQPQVSWNT
ncbi:MAG: hypothetical protein DYG89_38955 [Caldilinea sp. CFX5]|nr:hypothetical protein [Caldilinea sp. CFX5]